MVIHIQIKCFGLISIRFQYFIIRHDNRQRTYPLKFVHPFLILALLCIKHISKLGVSHSVVITEKFTHIIIHIIYLSFYECTYKILLILLLMTFT